MGNKTEFMKKVEWDKESYGTFWTGFSWVIIGLILLPLTDVKIIGISISLIIVGSLCMATQWFLFRKVIFVKRGKNDE